ncbi:LOW QUALITY PROTEIN: GPI mannosyltransferase 1-like [Haliotis rubra]|uniref:LOW QUALITY PROTEIN: GPI mannosyltransferase 1-like n=1 Tax=Haliotis rubra TaxID=36100 RepID=UPI001EE55C94|nr:LOW QUALITY PROTEIN: GPI mannosyltransferase 1-like [Haliotis rubra]
MWKYCILGLVARLALLMYGEWQDRTMEVKFTDVDYFVFDDAASFVNEGQSPYERATYRYTPLLAFMLLPNKWFHSFGKILFIIFDVLTGALTYSIVSSKGHSHKTAVICTCLWLFNPLPMAVSSRGNAESIMSFLVLATLQLLENRHIFLSAVSYALAVHFKIYPVTYALPLYLLLGKDFEKDKVQRFPRSKFTQLKKRTKDDVFVLKEVLLDLVPNINRLVFALVGAVVLGGLTAVFYLWYGWEFLYETYLYHVVRQDTRHNFSPYFYMLYLMGVAPSSTWIKILAFLPQLLLVLTFAIKFYKDPPFCWFLITFAFVALNKVCTSQYFLWYLCLVPLILPLINISVSRGVVLTTLWFLGQGIWLLPAYYLEFEGMNTFLYIWAAGLSFFTINTYILYILITCYRPVNSQTRTKTKVPMKVQ